MCGIAGVLSWQNPPDQRVVESMLERLIHRGPDAGGVFAARHVVLGARRLAVIDLAETSNQPLHSHDRSLSIVFNGEIYNHELLRRTLERDGARFRTCSDTEVILEAYRRWGTECLQRFVGMFAFALWDEQAQLLFLARDRLGEKPLYFYPLPEGGLAFASELKALLEYPRIPPKLNPRAISHFFSLNYTLADECIFDEVEKLHAAHYLLARRGRELSQSRYWDLAAHFRSKHSFASEQAAEHELQAFIDRAVESQLVADVPLGAFLSGGIDSSMIVEAMSRIQGRAATRSFTMGFAEQSYDELPRAREVARVLGVSHQEKLIESDLTERFSDIIEAADEPFADSSMIPLYYLAKFAREHVTVCLSGDGADELLGGYQTYLADRLHRLTHQLPSAVTRPIERLVAVLLPVSFSKVSFDYRLRQFVTGLPLSSRRAHHHWRTIFSRQQKKTLLRPAFRELAPVDGFEIFEPYFDEVSDCHYLDQALYVDTKTWLADDILTKVDRATMAHSLEARTPFLDHRLVEFAASLPVDLKIRGMRTKYLLKKVALRRLPKGTVEQRKMGFNAPVSEWLSGRLSSFSKSVIEASPLYDWVEPDAVAALWREHEARKKDHGLRLFGLVSLAVWMKRYA